MQNQPFESFSKSRTSWKKDKNTGDNFDQSICSQIVTKKEIGDNNNQDLISNLFHKTNIGGDFAWTAGVMTPSNNN